MSAASWALAALSFVAAPCAIGQSTTVFSGVPRIKVSEGGVERTPEAVPAATAENLACVISEIGGQFYWASRENKLLRAHQGGAFITFVAVDGSGYVRILTPAEKQDAAIMSPTEAAFDYVEHMLIGLRSVTYYGVARRATDRSSDGATSRSGATDRVESPGSERIRLAEDVVDSLALAREARKALGEARPDADDGGLSVMTAYRRAIAKLRAADSMLVGYSDSRNEGVAETASNTRRIYGSLLAALEGGLRSQEVLAAMQPGEPLAPVVSEASKHTAMAEDAWKALPIASSASLSHVLVDRQRKTADGKLGFLSITEQERQALLSKIALLFGAEVASGKVAGLHAAEGSAGLLARFLRQSWKTSDAR